MANTTVVYFSSEWEFAKCFAHTSLLKYSDKPQLRLSEQVVILAVGRPTL